MRIVHQYVLETAPGPDGPWTPAFRDDDLSHLLDVLVAVDRTWDELEQQGPSALPTTDDITADLLPPPLGGPDEPND